MGSTKGNDMTYEIHQNDLCLTDGDTKAEAISAATDYLENLYMEDNIYGEYTEEAILFNTETEEAENITLTLICERDYYDGGRSDYYAGLL